MKAYNFIYEINPHLKPLFILFTTSSNLYSVQYIKIIQVFPYCDRLYQLTPLNLNHSHPKYYLNIQILIL